MFHNHGGVNLNPSKILKIIVHDIKIFENPCLIELFCSDNPACACFPLFVLNEFLLAIIYQTSSNTFAWLLLSFCKSKLRSKEISEIASSKFLKLGFLSYSIPSGLIFAPIYFRGRQIFEFSRGFDIVHG